VIEEINIEPDSIFWLQATAYHPNWRFIYSPYIGTVCTLRS
jgi:hypothetical protein